jgi:hypothetical protein
MKYILFFFTTITFGQVQKFIPIDDDTHEFIEEVDYTLYYNKKPIYSFKTSKDTITFLPKDTFFDSIVFSKKFYRELGLNKTELKNVVQLKKIVYELNEVIVPNTKPNEIIIGEKSRFIKRFSTHISKDLNYGLLFQKEDLQKKLIKRLLFHVEKVKYKTKYKIKFFAAKEIPTPLSSQKSLDINDLLFESPTLILEKGIKNDVEVELESYDIDTRNGDIFVCLELQDYYDENENVIVPLPKETTKLKFQLSKLTYYYAKTYDIYTRESSTEMTNINAMVIEDFAYMFLKKPHKSTLVAPAIILFATKEE